MTRRDHPPSITTPSADTEGEGARLALLEPAPRDVSRAMLEAWRDGIEHLAGSDPATSPLIECARRDIRKRLARLERD